MTALRGGPVENPASCGICGRAWDFVSDAPFGLGVIRAVHPPSPCVAPIERPDDEPEFELRQEFGKATIDCAGCGEPFTQKRCSQKYCRPRCRVLHVERARPMDYRCSVCDKAFTSTRANRATCGAGPCRREHQRRLTLANFRQFGRRRAA